MPGDVLVQTKLPRRQPLLRQRKLQKSLVPRLLGAATTAWIVAEAIATMPEGTGVQQLLLTAAACPAIALVFALGYRTITLVLVSGFIVSLVAGLLQGIHLDDPDVTSTVEFTQAFVLGWGSSILGLLLLALTVVATRSRS